MPPTANRSPRQTSAGSGRTGRLSEAPEALFAYGSLQFPDVLFALIGRVPEHEPAAAEGWRVVPLPGRVYPALVLGETTARGYLLTGLTPSEWRVLDAFEDPVYELRQLRLSDGRQGWAYLCPSGTEVGSGDWSLDTFRSEHLAAYVGRCAAWRQRYDQANERAS